MVLQERYRILRKLGDGGMGAVYEGEHVLIKRRVAIKVLHSQFAQNPEIVARFHREAEAATAIGHPNIVEVTDMGRFPDGTAFMVLELLKGRDWAKDIATEGPQPLGKVVHIVSQVCDALSAAHAMGIVHRDLKPENIFLIERGGDPNFVKVLDFGISKIADASAENRSLTQTGTALGTPYYMAPEQCQGKKDVDLRADIYSLGVILFQALTRQYPFDDESYPMLVLKICTEPPPPIGQYRPDLPPEVQHIVNRMLAKDRAHRFASCEEVKAALEPFRGVNAPPVLAANAPSTASRGPSVLEQRGSVPAMTPTGTAYLPSSPGDASVASAPAPKSSMMLFAIVGVLFVLVLVGGGLGAAAAWGLFRSGPDDADRPAAGPARARDEAVVDRTAPPSPPADPAAPTVAAPAATVAPAAAEPAPAPAAVQAPAETVRLRIEVEGPEQASVTIDGVPYGGVPLEADMPRDPAPAAGEAPAVHTIEIRAEGYETYTEQVSFRIPLRRTIRMRPLAGARPSRRGPAHAQAAAPEARPLEPAAPAEPRPQGGTRPQTVILDPFRTSRQPTQNGTRSDLVNPLR
ncbi:MAG TPA: serine/threonine-protein kinase [Sandaracinaceae bacterium]